MRPGSGDPGCRFRLCRAHRIDRFPHASENSYGCSPGRAGPPFLLLELGGRTIAQRRQKDLVLLKDLLEARKIVPVIDRRYPLRDVAKAVRYLEEGHAQGKVVITIAHSNDTQRGAAQLRQKKESI